MPEAFVPLAPLTTLGVGGPARWYVDTRTVGDIGDAVAWASSSRRPVFVLGGGSNLVVSDQGFDGVVLRVGLRGMSQTGHGDDLLVTAAAGERWDDVVASTVEEGVAGIECLSGIPGTVGATPIQNVGAYGQEVASTIVAVRAFDRQSQTVVDLGARECGFEYRSSRFKVRDAARFIVCDVTFRLARRPPLPTYPDIVDHMRERGIESPEVKDVRRAVLTVRASKSMVLDEVDPNARSVGSFFLNPVVASSRAAELAGLGASAVPTYPVGQGRVKIPAAWLLEQAGCHRGYGEGRVGLSSRHTLAVVNRGGATASEVVAFAAGLKRRVADRFGIVLEPEPTFVGFGDNEHVRYLKGDHL